MTDTNNITKYEALEAISNDKQVRKKGCQHYIRLACVEGKEYSGLFEDRYMMSYICRAYNITEYGASKQQNRIKNVLNKYSEEPGFNDAFKKIFEEYPNGIPDEYPKFVDLLKEYMLEIDRFDEDAICDDYLPLWSENHESAPNRQNTNSASHTDNSLIGRIIAAIILVLIVLAILSKLGIGIVELGLIAGIIYLIVRKIKSPKKIKQSKPKSSSSSYYSAAQKSVKKQNNKQYGSAANKRNSPFVFKPTKGGVALLVIMCLWAMSGYANGGSPIICLIMVIIGLSGVIKKK